jgi:hypothetical protein
MSRLLYVNAIIKTKVRNREVQYECPGVLIKEGDTHLPRLMCQQCGVKDAEIVSYEIIREIGTKN